MFLLLAAADALWFWMVLAAGFSAIFIKQNTKFMCCSNLLP